MSLLLGQLVYTSFFGVGFQCLSSSEITTEIQQAFIEHIVYRYWNSYNPPKLGYRAVYLYQISADQTLFGWLYNDAVDEWGRGNVPYFICYYLNQSLQLAQLEVLYTCLNNGPVALVTRQNPPRSLEAVTIADVNIYQSTVAGVAIPFRLQKQCQMALGQEKLLDLFVSMGDVVEWKLDKRHSRLEPLQNHYSVKAALSSFSAQLWSWKLGVAVTTMLVASVVSFLLKPMFLSSFRDNHEVTAPDTPALETIEPASQSRAYSSINAPGFPVGTPESVIKTALGEPSSTAEGSWQNTDAVLYRLSNQVTLSYTVDRYSRRIRQTEVLFTQSVDKQAMLATLNGMLGGQTTELVKQGLQKVQQQQQHDYLFAKGSLEGRIAQTESAEITISIWDAAYR